MKRSKYLISGSSSGLGKYLREELGGGPFNRAGPNIKKTDVIIHCAFNKSKEVNSKSLYQYLLDNLFLTERLIKIPHKKFIYVSSVDVYPKDNKKHSEDEVIDINQTSGIYAITKSMSESIIQSICSNFLILRCSALLGADVKENTLTKIIKEEKPTLTVTSNSVFNFVSHKSVLEFIKIATEKDLQGVYNLASKDNIALSQVVEFFGKKVNFGNYTYNVGDIDNKKASKILPYFKKTSKEVINEFTKIIA